MSTFSVRWLTIKLFSLMLALIILGTQIAPAIATASSTTTQLNIWVEDSLFVPCANGGAGEWVDFAGWLHVVSHTTVDDQGGFHMNAVFNSKGMPGIGQETGDKYFGNGAILEQLNGQVGAQVTSLTTIHLIGSGPDNNLKTYILTRMTVNANGEVTASIDDFRVTCQ